MRVNKIRSLTAFNPFLRYLRAYNADNFNQSDRNRTVQSTFLVFSVTVLLALLPISVVLTVWNLSDQNSTMKKAIPSAPILLAILQMFLQGVALIKKSQHIHKTIERLQTIISRRKVFV